MIYKGTFFRESALAHKLLDGMKCLEVGGSRHNQWGLDIVNVDKFGADDPRGQIYRDEQVRLCGQFLPVDIVAPGDKIPVADKSFDAVIASHVIEHIFDPIAALKEWARIARRYIYIIWPHPKELPSDQNKLLTTMPELWARHNGKIPDPGTDEHHSRWDLQGFVELCASLGFYVSHTQQDDDKVGNGSCVVIDLQPPGNIVINPELEPKGIIEVVKKRKK